MRAGCGWGMVIATIIVLSNLAAVAVQFLYLTLARIFDHESWADLGTSNKVVNIGTTVVLLALATYVSMRGVTTSERIQYYLVGFQMIVLLVFATVALVQGRHGRRPRRWWTCLRHRLVQSVHRNDHFGFRRGIDRIHLRLLGLGHLSDPWRGNVRTRNAPWPRRIAVRAHHSRLCTCSSAWPP